MKIFSLTKTLKSYNNQLHYTLEKSEAEIIIVGGKKINLTEFPNLKGIFKTGVGVDNIPFIEAKKRNIEIRLPSEQTKNYIYKETASFAVYLILNCLYKNIFDFNSWEKYSRKVISAKKVLLIGQGNIGKMVKKYLNQLVDVLTFDVKTNKLDDLTHFVKQADCISLHLPLNKNTKNLVDSNFLDLMKLNSSLVNTSRGGIVNESALEEKLKQNKIYAAMDVFSSEPYSGSLNIISENRLMRSPHVASTSLEFYEGLAKDFVQFYDDLKK